VLVGYLGHFDVWLARFLFPRRTIVLDHLVFAATTAADRGVGDRGLRLRLLRALDRAALRIADIVLVDTAEHAELVPDPLRRKVLVVPVGATAPWFDAAESGSGGTEPLRVVFFGLFTPLQGATTIGAALGMLPAAAPIRVTMIGSGQDLAAARRAAGGGDVVDWLPWVDADALPALVAGHDVGLGIFGTTPKAAKVVPNKVYQCAAAGIAVVTSDTAPQRRAFGDGAVFVPAGDPGALAAELLRLADDRDALRSARSAARRAAEAYRPEAVVRDLDARLRAG
jgi:glycosyltransferase involved in cell wall biosynthesis